MRRELDVNGVKVTAEFAPEDVERVLVPLLAELTRRRRGMSGRLIAFLAAPPGAGKSTLAAYLEQLSRERPGLERVQAL
ncbi:MAG: nucleoside/nucleotide kinase family protein, partial [Candidatus Spyradocola sp.]